MKREDMVKAVMKTVKNRKFWVGAAAVVVAVAVGVVSSRRNIQEPDFPMFVHAIPETTIEAEDSPLASGPSVTTSSKTKTKTAKKKVKLSAVSDVTKTNNLGTKTSTKTKTVETDANTTVKTVVTKAVTTTEKYTKGSDIKLVTKKTKTTTTVTTTVVPAAVAAQDTASAPVTATASADATATPTPIPATKREVSVRSIAPQMDSRVLSAFETLGFKVIIDPTVNYSGYFNAQDRTITMRTADNSIYHELGHFLAFITGNTDQSASFVSAFNSELASFPTDYGNKTYASSSSAEYFGECTRIYVLAGSTLQSASPVTYSEIAGALDKVTDAQINMVKTVYGPYWK